MATLPDLAGPMDAPPPGVPVDSLVVLLHGVGADGHDLIGLAPELRRALPGACFLSPDAPDPFEMAPMGRQWFPIGDLGQKSRLEGVRRAGPILDAYLDRQLERFGLGHDRLALLGFSQGAMMALHVGLRRARVPAAVVGYSGMLVGPEVLAAEIRSRPPVLLIHGDADEVVPFQALGIAQQALAEAGVPVEARIRPGLGHGIDAEGLDIGRAFLKRTLRRPATPA